jgi:NADH-quinone oxidoreductase subunit L
MGGLKKHLPATHRTFWIGVLAISGIPLFSGFFSKDEILHAAAGGGHWVLWAVALFTAGLTAFYMGRAFYMTFHGKFRGTHEEEHHLHESPPSMTIPLWVLAAGAVVAGFVGIPKLFTGRDLNLFHRFLDPAIAKVHGHGHEAHHMAVGLEWGLVLLAVTVGAVGLFFVARKLYRDRGVATDEAFAAKLPAVQKVLANKYYVDEAYDATVIRGTWGLGRGLFRFDAGFIDGFLVNGTRNLTVHLFSQLSGLFDKFVVDGLVNLVGSISSLLSRIFRRVQTGYVGSYALVMAAGMFVLVCVYLFLR